MRWRANVHKSIGMHGWVKLHLGWGGESIKAGSQYDAKQLATCKYFRASNLVKILICIFIISSEFPIHVK